MSWFDSSGWASMAKTALSSAQKTIDQALDIKDSGSTTPYGRKTIRKKLKDDNDSTDLFASFGVSNLLSSKDKSSNPTKGGKQSEFFSWSDWGKEDKKKGSEGDSKPLEDDASSSNEIKRSLDPIAESDVKINCEASEGASSVIKDSEFSVEQKSTTESSSEEVQCELSDECPIPKSETSVTFDVTHHDECHTVHNESVVESRWKESEIPEGTSMSVSDCRDSTANEFASEDGSGWDVDCAMNEQWDVELDFSNSSLAMLPPKTAPSLSAVDPVHIDSGVNTIEDESELKHFDNSEVQSMDDSELKPVDESELKSVNDSEAKSIEDFELKPADDSELKTLDDSGSKPSDDSVLKPIDDSEVKSIEDFELKPAEDSELKPSDDYELKPVDDFELKSIDNIQDCKLKPVDNFEQKPFDDSELKPLNDSEPKPIHDSELKPLDDSELKSIDDPEPKLADDSQEKPIYNPDLQPAHDSKQKPSDNSQMNMNNVCVNECCPLDTIQDEGAVAQHENFEEKFPSRNDIPIESAAEHKEIERLEDGVLEPQGRLSDHENSATEESADVTLTADDFTNDAADDQSSNFEELRKESAMGYIVNDSIEVEIQSSELNDASLDDEISKSEVSDEESLLSKIGKGTKTDESDENQLLEVGVEESEIQTSSDTLVLSEEDPIDSLNNTVKSGEETSDDCSTPKHDTHCSQSSFQSIPFNAELSLATEEFNEENQSETPIDSSESFSESHFADDNNVCDKYRDMKHDDSSASRTSTEEGDQRSDRSASSSSSLSSFVKFPTSEDDMMQKSSCSPPSHSSSDILKIDVEMMSGHTSGDELETTTSSDIEIISSPNGGSSTSGRESRSSASPGKQLSNFGNTSAMASTNSDGFKGSIHHSVQVTGQIACQARNCMSKNRKHLSTGLKYDNFNKGSRKRTTSETSSEEAESQPSPAFIKKMSDMAAVIDAREAKLVEMSKENVQLKDSNIQLQEQVDQLKMQISIDQTEVRKINSEFQNQLAAMETKLQNSNQKRESLEKELRITKKEVNQMLRPEEIQGALQEKELQIQELLLEGEKLSKQHLQHSNIIKKLRAKEKETDEILKNNKDLIQEKNQEVEVLKKKANDKGESEKKLTENVKQLTLSIQQLEKQLAQAQSDLEDSNERNKGLKFSLESSSKEIGELKKMNLARNSEAEEAVLSAEMSMKERLRQALDQAEKAARDERDSLLSQIEELQICVARTEKKSNYREEMLRQEISSLQERLQETECRNDEMSQNISAATRPLLRQIENLQATFSAQSQSFEGVEKNLTDRLLEAQRQLAVANEREKVATERYMDISSRSSTLESQNSALLCEKTVLVSALDNEKSNLKCLEEEKAGFAAEIQDIKNSCADEIAYLKKCKAEADIEITLYKEKYEIEKKSAAYLQDQLEKEKNASIILSESSNYSSGANTPMSMSRMSSVSDNPWIQEDVLSQSLMSLSSNQANKMSVYDTLRAGNNTSSLIESLQSQLKQREGEIIHLQNDMSNMDKIRESMSQELVRLTTINDKVLTELESLKELKVKFNNMESEYNALLQMYGEKVEEAQELRMDLQDVKDMYRAQIDQLLQQKT